MTDASKEKQPRSIRLNAGHRSDMMNAVMKEWAKQNPPPSQDMDTELMLLVAKELKKSKYCKDSEYFKENLSTDQQKMVHTTHEVVLKIETEEGTDDNSGATYTVRIPPSFAAKQKIPFFYEYPGTFNIYVPTYRPDLIFKSVAEPHEHMPDTAQKERIACRAVCFPVKRGSDVQIRVKRNNPTLVKMRKLKRLRKVWENDRDKLRDETRDVLDQIGSTKQLREQWPAMVGYLPPHIADPDRAINLPVLSIDRLSERLGLK